VNGLSYEIAEKTTTENISSYVTENQSNWTERWPNNKVPEISDLCTAY
jgi:hypothetical protein